jgi:hypothetical protein
VKYKQLTAKPLSKEFCYLSYTKKEETHLKVDERNKINIKNDKKRN